MKAPIIRTAVIISAAILFFATSVLALDETSTVEGIAVTFSNRASNPATDQDVRDVKKAFDDAVAKSATFKAKVEDAGGKFRDKKIVVFVRRGARDVLVARATTIDMSSVQQGIINIDLADLDTLKNHLTSTSEAAKETLAKSDLISSLAHEFDHLRDGVETEPAKRKHNDPPNPTRGKASIPGPAVDDENAVNKELGTGVTRSAYGRVDIVDQNDPSKDVKVVPHKVNGVDVALKIMEFKNATGSVQRRFPGTTFGVAPATIETIPEKPCTTSGESSCYPPACGVGTGDEDCDGVRPKDNCPTLANPQQADFDGDGIGSGCDSDEPFFLCDSNLDRNINITDITLIFAARGQAAVPGGLDQRDSDADGFISVNDARICTLQCANPLCAP